MNTTESASSHEDRIRSRKSFTASLILGVIAGGIFGTAVEQIADMMLLNIETSLLSIATSFILILISTGLILYALRASERFESKTLVYEIRLAFKSLQGIIESAAGRCVSQSELRRVLDDYNALVSNKSSFSQANIQTLRKFSLELQEASQDIKDPFLASSLEKIHKFPDRLHELGNELREGMLSSKVFEEKGWTSKQSNEALQISKFNESGKTSKIATVLLQSNLDKRLSVPYVCYITISPTVSISEYTHLRSAIDAMFASVLGSKNALEFGLLRYVPEEQAQLEKLKSEVKEPILRKIDEIIKTLEIHEEFFQDIKNALQ